VVTPPPCTRMWVMRACQPRSPSPRRPPPSPALLLRQATPLKPLQGAHGWAPQGQAGKGPYSSLSQGSASLLDHIRQERFLPLPTAPPPHAAPRRPQDHHGQHHPLPRRRPCRDDLVDARDAAEARRRCEERPPPVPRGARLGKRGAALGCKWPHVTGPMLPASPPRRPRHDRQPRAGAPTGRHRALSAGVTRGRRLSRAEPLAPTPCNSIATTDCFWQGEVPVNLSKGVATFVGAAGRSIGTGGGGCLADTGCTRCWAESAQMARTVCACPLVGLYVARHP
jgi:hypothetical protein